MSTAVGGDRGKTAHATCYRLVVTCSANFIPPNRNKHGSSEQGVQPERSRVMRSWAWESSSEARSARTVSVQMRPLRPFSSSQIVLQSAHPSVGQQWTSPSIGQCYKGERADEIGKGTGGDRDLQLNIHVNAAACARAAITGPGVPKMAWISRSTSAAHSELAWSTSQSRNAVIFPMLVCAAR